MSGIVGNEGIPFAQKESEPNGMAPDEVMKDETIPAPLYPAPEVVVGFGVFPARHDRDVY